MSDGEGSTAAARRTVLHRGRKFDLEVVELPGRNGKTLKREVVRHPGAVVILPLLDGPGGDPRVVLIQNHRPAVAKALYELPAGTLEKGEPPEACAARELIEETGYRAATLTPLGRFYTSPGMSDELMWAYAATGLTEVGQELEEDENLTVHPVGAREAIRMIDSGELIDGKSMLTILLGLRRGLIQE
jgi:ADP-ribose pyrophosphatase